MRCFDNVESICNSKHLTSLNRISMVDRSGENLKGKNDTQNQQKAATENVVVKQNQHLELV